MGKGRRHCIMPGIQFEEVNGFVLGSVLQAPCLFTLSLLMISDMDVNGVGECERSYQQDLLCSKLEPEPARFGNQLEHVSLLEFVDVVDCVVCSSSGSMPQLLLTASQPRQTTRRSL